MEFGQDGDLLYDVVDLILGVLDVDDFDRYRLAVPLVDSKQRQYGFCIPSGGRVLLPLVYFAEAASTCLLLALARSTRA